MARPRTTETIDKYLLSLAGEYRVCSELNKRGVFATMTYGHRKGADVYAIGGRDRPAIRIEVKTSQRNNFVTNITKKGLAESREVPDFWVLCQIKGTRDGKFEELFFVLTHAEACFLQKKVNDDCAERYRVRHGSPSNSTGGVDNIPLRYLEPYKDGWSKIVQFIGGKAVARRKQGAK